MRFLTATIAVAALVSGLAACSSSSGTRASTAASGATSPPAVTVAAAPTTATNVVSPAATAPTSATAASSSTTVAAPASTAPPSPTGVPGIAAGDGFCAAWARYSGSVQIIAVAVNFAELTSVQSAELELESAPSIVDAVAQIDGAWPAVLATEHAAAVDGYLGPFARRAAKAVSALRGTGATDAQVAQVHDEWAHVLATRDPDAPTVAVELPADIGAEVDAGATAFDAAVTPWGTDPSLAVDFDAIPLTKQYLAEHCPDLASIGVGDDV